MDAKDMVTITDAAKKLGISRPRLSKLIAENKVEKVKAGRAYKINYYDVQELVQTLAADGKMRTRKGTEQVKERNKEDRLLTHLESELKILREERDSLRDKVEALSSVAGEVKLLKAMDAEKSIRETALLDRIEVLEADLKKERGENDKNKKSIISRVFDAVRDV